MPWETMQVFDVDGLTCSSCAVRVEKQLRGAPGVDAATVNFASGKAFVSGDVAVPALARELDKIGYRLIVPDAEVHRTEPGGRARTELVRMIAAIALTVPLVVLHWLHIGWAGVSWIQLALAAAVVAWPGRLFFVRGARLAIRGSANMDTLVALGSGAALVYGAVLLLAGEPGPYYFDAAGMILSFILVGRYLEARATARAGAALRSLLDLSPKQAARVVDGETELVAVTDLVAGDLVRVGPGERVPVDGKIASGTSELDESIATGESLPVTRAPGDEVLGGTINGSGVLEIRAIGVGADSFLQQMVRLVEEAQGSKPPIQRLADRLSGVFVPVIIVVATITGLLWYLVAGADALGSLLPAVAVLLIACPCALGLATPTAVLAASGRAAREGILVRNGAALEASSRLDVLVADKTGTLTDGRPTVTQFEAAGDSVPVEEILGIAAALEQASEHPLGRAVLDYARDRTDARPPIADVRAEPGAGISGTIGSDRVGIGTAAFAASHGVAIDLAQDRRPAASRAFLFTRDELLGVFYIEDTIRADVETALDDLRAAGVELQMATGDTEAVARHVAQRLGIDRIAAELSPADKKRLVERLRADGRHVGMVGDGINDAPALASADVGFAIGTGTDVALQTADVTLVGGDLGRVARAIRISKRTLRIVKQNLFWALIYNGLAIPVAALGFLQPQIAAAAMALSSICVVANSIRLQRRSRDIRANPNTLADAAATEDGEMEPSEIRIQVGGMTCQHCVHTVTQAVKGVAGVTDVTVSLNPGEAKVSYEAAVTKVEQLKAAIRNAGYRPAE
jgi:Cu+-exporting ATPase